MNVTRELDHVGVAIKDLERGRAIYQRLGFRRTARSIHSGSREPGGPVEPWGSGNHCAMFEQGYLEIIGLTDPTRYSSVQPMVAAYEGLHIVAIGCGSADAAYAEFQRAGAPVDAVRSLERDAAFGVQDEAIRRARFRNMYVDRTTFSEAKFLFIEHLTREVLWQPHLLQHPNTAVGIEAVYFVSNDPAATAQKFAGLFSQDHQETHGAHRLRLARGELWVTTPEAWRSRVPGKFLPPLPAPAGFGVRVRSLATTREWLTQQGVAIQTGMHDGSSFWVAPEEAGGAAIQFIQA